ncbi:hypothetical protein GCM10009624_06750 [Gordonia sinesedis]
MHRWKKAAGSVALGCAVCLGAVAPTVVAGTLTAGAAAATASLAPHTRTQLHTLMADGVIDRASPESFAEGQSDWFVNDTRVGRDTLMVVSPGTDDTELYPRIKGMRGGRYTVVVDYPQALGPFVSGNSGALLPIFAPSYDASRDIAIRKNLAVMRRLNGPQTPFVIYTGFSQGAEALGNAAETASRNGTLDPTRNRVVLVADPRSPWGAKPVVAGEWWAAGTVRALGAAANGARDPARTGDLDVTSVIIEGDPAADLNWDPQRPVGSVLVGIAGFVTIHAGRGAQNYSTLNTMAPPRVLRSTDGNTTYLVYRPDHHPFTMMGDMALRKLGIRTPRRTLNAWDSASEGFYRLRPPTPDNAYTSVVEAGTDDDQPGRRAATTDDTTAPSTEPAPTESQRPDGRRSPTNSRPDAETDGDARARSDGSAGSDRRTGRTAAVGTVRLRQPLPDGPGTGQPRRQSSPSNPGGGPG